MDEFNTPDYEAVNTDSINQTEDNLPNDERLPADNKADVSDDSLLAENSYTEEVIKDKKPQKKRSNAVFAAMITAGILGITLIVSLICVALGFTKNHPDLFKEEDDKLKIELPLQSRPEASEEFIDENGKYTTQGIAKYIRQSVLEIYVYNKKGGAVLASGSGIVLTKDGYIVTNQHVIANNAYITATDYNGKEYEARVIGGDAKTDIAVVKINASNLTPAVFGNSDDVLQGEPVMTIGNPGGFTGSVTYGIVSGIDRKVKTSQTALEMQYIQTDAPISPGNSGGALVNMYGQVIGIVSSKYSANGYEGMGFAICSNEAKPIIEELMQNGYVSGRVKIGITFYSNTTVSTPISRYSKGVSIISVSEDCDIFKQDIKEGDILTELDGINVYDYDSVTEVISGKKAGDKVTAVLLREEGDSFKEITISFKLMNDTGE